MTGTEAVTEAVSDPVCLQCGEQRSTVRAESLFCCTLSVGESVEVDQEWEHHRWADWTDAELGQAGIKAAAYDRHRRTDAGVLAWVACEDTVRGHNPAGENDVGVWVDRLGQCTWCGQQQPIRDGQNGDTNG